MPSGGTDIYSVPLVPRNSPMDWTQWTTSHAAYLWRGDKERGTAISSVNVLKKRQKYVTGYHVSSVSYSLRRQK